MDRLDRHRDPAGALGPEPDEPEPWVSGLTAQGAVRDRTIERLHVLLLRIARGEARRRSGINGIVGQELDDLAQQAAGDALMSILRKVSEFRGESRFTTWAYKFVIYEVSNKLGRHVWRREGVHFDEDSWEQLPARLGAGPEEVAESQAMVAAVQQAVEAELTAHQRRVFVAVVVNATPLDALVIELGTNRNAIYKTLFDARRKLRASLIGHGLLGTGSEDGR